MSSYHNPPSEIQDHTGRTIVAALNYGGFGFIFGAGIVAASSDAVIWVMVAGLCLVLAGAILDWQCRCGVERTFFLYAAGNRCAVISCFIPPLYVAAVILRLKVMPQMKAALSEEEFAVNRRTMNTLLVAPWFVWLIIGTSLLLTVRQGGW